MKKLLRVSRIRWWVSLLWLFTYPLQAQVSSAWQYIRPSNTGLGGDYQQCIEIDNCGNKWTGGFLPFFSEGSVTRFDDSVFTCWSNFEGYLPADRVYAIAFDDYDGVWVATNGVSNGIEHGGISHYNGVTWTSYTSANSPLPEDDMRGIVVDHDNVVWATFFNVVNGVGGVSRFDGTNWTIYLPGNSNLPNGYLNDIDVDEDNNIWIGSNSGLIKFDGLNWITYTVANSDISADNILDVEVDESTNKIYVALGISVDAFDGTTWTHYNATNAPLSTTGLYEVDARGDTLMIGTLGGSYLCYIFDGTNWISHPEPNHCYDVRIDADGNFWMCGIGFLEKFDGISWTQYNTFNTGLASMFNNSVFVDSKNRTWFGSSANGGINVFNCPEWQSYNPYNAGLWPQPIDYTGFGAGITEDSFGDIWMVYSGVAGGVVQIPDGDINNAGAWIVWENDNSGVSLQFMYRAGADQSGNVWFGYDGACSVTKYSHATNSWTNYNLYALGQISCGAGSGIKNIRIDADNNVWVCGLAGLAKFDQTNWTFYSYLNTPMEQGFVYDIAFDAFGNKWIGTEHGLFKFDGTNWTKYDHTNTALIGESAIALLFDKSGTLWVSSVDLTYPSPSGLCSFDGTTCTQYTTDNSGLPEKYVNDLALDTLGNIWVLTQGRGAAIFNPDGVAGYDCIDQSLQSCSFTTGIASNASASASLAATAFPNPFSSATTIEFTLPLAEDITISIYDVTGRMVTTVSPVNLTAGKNKITVDLSTVNNGIYFLKIQSNENLQTVKLIKN